MDEGTAQHGLDPEVRLGNHETMRDTKMKLGLDENWTIILLRKQTLLSDQGLSWNTTSLVVSFS